MYLATCSADAVARPHWFTAYASRGADVERRTELPTAGRRWSVSFSFLFFHGRPAQKHGFTATVPVVRQHGHGNENGWVGTRKNKGLGFLVAGDPVRTTGSGPTTRSRGGTVTRQPVRPVGMTTGPTFWSFLVLWHIRRRHAVCLWRRL